LELLGQHHQLGTLALQERRGPQVVRERLVRGAARLCRSHVGTVRRDQPETDAIAERWLREPGESVDQCRHDDERWKAVGYECATRRPRPTAVARVAAGSAEMNTTAGVPPRAAT